MAESVEQLEYAKAPAWHRRRGVRRTVWLAVLLGCGLASAKWLEAGWGHAKLLYWQGKCLRYAAPAGKLIDQNGKSSVKEWEEFYALLSPPGRRAAPVVFLGEMRRKDGGRRLVAVESATLLPTTQRSEMVLGVDCHVIVPGGTWSRPRLAQTRGGTIRGCGDR